MPTIGNETGPFYLRRVCIRKESRVVPVSRVSASEAAVRSHLISFPPFSVITWKPKANLNTAYCLKLATAGIPSRGPLLASGKDRHKLIYSCGSPLARMSVKFPSPLLL